MKKARIVLSLVALFAVAGGALAFKAMRNGQPVYTLSNAYTTFGTIYTRANATYLPAQPARFITTTGTQLTTVISTTAVVAGQTVTLQRIGGTQTITFPVFEGVQIADTYTTAVN